MLEPWLNDVFRGITVNAVRSTVMTVRHHTCRICGQTITESIDPKFLDRQWLDAHPQEAQSFINRILGCTNCGWTGTVREIVEHPYRREDGEDFR